jgi:SAM-dependent methyltransferase
VILYSPAWFRTFLETVPAEQTAREVGFLRRVLPLPAYRLLVDLCCGQGRHAVALAEAGYDVMGVDADAAALSIARRERADRPITFLRADMRDLRAVPTGRDAVICMWQSFGYFDADQNFAVLRGNRDRLRPGGRLVLDIYHHDFFEAHQGHVETIRNGVQIVEDKRVHSGRLTVSLTFDGRPGDTFNWQLFTAGEIEEFAAEGGLRMVLACSDFNEDVAPSPDTPRMQLVFERPH